MRGVKRRHAVHIVREAGHQFLETLKVTIDHERRQVAAESWIMRVAIFQSIAQRRERNDRFVILTIPNCNIEISRKIFSQRRIGLERAPQIRSVDNQ